MARRREREVVRYLRTDVAPNAPLHLERLRDVLGETGLRSLDDLGRVPVTTLADVGDPAALVLRPPGPRSAGRRGRRARRALDHLYKPVHWFVQEGVPIGSSATDLDRLGRLGARWLASAGVQADDVVLGFLPAGPHLPYWELVLGARQLGVSAVQLPPLPGAEEVGRLRPTVLVGRPFDLSRLLQDGGRRAPVWRSQVRLVIAVGEALDAGLRAGLEASLDAPGAAVTSAWAPPGVRSLWWECLGGSALHTSPDAEVVQIVDPLSGTQAPPGADGEVVWTPLGWHGSVLVRLRTGVFATLDSGPCPSCGEDAPRLTVSAAAPSFLGALDRHEGVAGWQAELRMSGGREELVVFLSLARRARLEPLLVDLDADLAATQYVVLDRRSLDARLAAHEDRRVLDLRN